MTQLSPFAVGVQGRQRQQMGVQSVSAWTTVRTPYGRHDSCRSRADATLDIENRAHSPRGVRSCHSIARPANQFSIDVPQGQGSRASETAPAIGTPGEGWRSGHGMDGLRPAVAVVLLCPV
jgi:hypothetical protein